MMVQSTDKGIFAIETGKPANKNDPNFQSALSIVLFLDLVERWTRTRSVPIIPAFFFYTGF